MVEPAAYSQTPAPEETKEQELISWSSPSRIFKRRDREFFTNLGAIVFLLTIILVFAREYILIITALSVVFLIYVLSTVPPENVPHRITNLGIESAGYFYRWETLVDFWFERQWGQTLLVLRPALGPRTVILLAEGQSEEAVKEMMATYIPFREKPQHSWVDNAARWITEKIPLENPQT